MHATCQSFWQGGAHFYLERRGRTRKTQTVTQEPMQSHGWGFSFGRNVNLCQQPSWYAVFNRPLTDTYKYKDSSSMAYRLGCNNTVHKAVANMQPVIQRLCLHVRIRHTSSKDVNIPNAWAQCIWVLQPCFVSSSYSCKQLTVNTLPIEAKVLCVVQLGMNKYSPQSL